MSATHTLTLTPKGDREIVVTRVFDAPRERVFDAVTTPSLIRQWLLGPDGWTMSVCEVIGALPPLYSSLEHDPEKRTPVFGKDHAPPIA